MKARTRIRVSSATTNHVARVACVLAALVFGSVASTQASPGEVVRKAGKLTLHHAVERDLGPGKADVCYIQVTWQFLRFQVEKKGVDVVAVVEDPGGTTLLTVDSPSHAFGLLPASLVTGRAGLYRIVIRKSPRSTETGRYRIGLTELRWRSEQDLFATAVCGRSIRKTVTSG